MKEEKLDDLRPYPVRARQAIVQLLKTGNACLFWMRHDYSPDTKESEHKARIKKFQKENAAAWKTISALVANKEKVGDILEFEPSAFSELPYGSFSLLVEPSSKKAKGQSHWSKDLSKRGIKSIQAINHKFAMWKSIMCEESVAHGQLP